MAAVPKADIKDIAYQIIAGYYPDIASSLRYQTGTAGAGTGKSGSTGAKYLKKRGFTDSSIQKARFETVKAETESTVLTGKKTPSGKPQTKTLVDYAARAAGMQEVQGSTHRWHGGEAPGKTQMVEEERRIQGKTENIWMWKGGSSHYKLFGDMVWHMHGKGTQADKNREMLEYLQKKDAKGNYIFNDKIPSFTSVYSDQEGALTKVASGMAREFFRKSLDRKIMNDFFEGDMGEISKKLKAGGQTQEEMGYSTDEFEYMAYGEAKKKFPELFDEKSKLTKANDRDMVKMTKGKSPTVEAILDVTEMPIDEIGHGVVETGFLDEVIANIKADDQDSLDAVSRAVEQMFIKAINTNFNPSIRKLKSFVKEQSGKEKGTTFEDILKAVKKDLDKGLKQGQKGVPSVSVENISRSAAVSWDRAGKEVYRNFAGGGKGSKEGMAYVVHMLATMGQKTADKYQQAHRVAEVPGGESVYAIIPLRQWAPHTKRGLEFKQNLKGKVETLVGYSATLALEGKYFKSRPDEAAKTMQAQKRNFMYTRVNGPIQNGRNSATHIARETTKGSALHSTTASYVGTDQLDKFFDEIMKNIRANPEKLNKAVAPVIESRTYGWDPTGSSAGRKMKKGGMGRSTQFWALPYVGIQHSEHVGKKKK